MQECPGSLLIICWHQIIWQFTKRNICLLTRRKSVFKNIAALVSATGSLFRLNDKRKGAGSVVSEFLYYNQLIGFWQSRNYLFISCLSRNVKTRSRFFGSSNCGPPCSAPGNKVSVTLSFPSTLSSFAQNSLDCWVGTVPSFVPCSIKKGGSSVVIQVSGLAFFTVYGISVIFAPRTLLSGESAAE